MTLNSRIVLVAGLLAALLSGCAAPPAPPQATQATIEPTTAPTSVPMTEPAPTAQSNSAYPVTIESCGRTLTFDKAPERVVTTYQPATDILLALGLADKIVIAGGNFGTLPIPPLREAFATLGEKVQEKIPQREAMLAAQPDLVVSTDPSYDFASANGNATIEDLAGVGAQAYAFQHRCGAEFTSGKIADGETDILNLGRIFGVEDRAKEYIASQQAVLADVASRVDSRTPVNAVIYGSGEGPINVYSGGLFAELIERAGGKNLFSSLGKEYGPVSLEEFATQQPDIYIVVGSGSEAEAKAEYLFKQFPEHPASKAKRWVAVGDNQFYAGASSAYTVEQFARAFHPEAYPADTASTVPLAYPVTVENCGRTLTFDKAPERVVSLWQPQNELLLALGLQDRIIAFAGMYAPLPSELAARAQGIKEIGTSIAWPTREVLLAEKPDLVVSELIEGFAFDDKQGRATVAEIEAAGANVYSASACVSADYAKKNVDTVFADIENFGKIFGVQDRATALIAQLKQRNADVAAKVNGLKPVRVAFYNGGEGPLNVLSGGVWGDAVTRAGGESVFPLDAFQVSNEEFAAAQPEVILVGTFPGQDVETLTAFLKKTFPDLPAVKSGRIYEVPTIEVEAGVRVMDGLERIAKALHPEAFK